MKLGFNLLRQQLGNEDKWDKIYEWITNTAKVLVIFTELIIVCVFVVRVVVDRRARELTKLLDYNKTQLEALAPIENDVRMAQQDIADFRTIWTQSSSYLPIIEEIYNLNKSLTNKLSIRFLDNGQIEISGLADRDDIESLEQSLKQSTSFNYVELIAFKPVISGSGAGLGTFQIYVNISPQFRSDFTKP